MSPFSLSLDGGTDNGLHCLASLMIHDISANGSCNRLRFVVDVDGGCQLFLRLMSSPSLGLRGGFIVRRTVRYSLLLRLT